MVRRLKHTGIVVADLVSTAAIWTDHFGLRSPRGLRRFPENAILQFMLPVGDGGAIALLQATQAGTPMHLAMSSGRGLFHVAFEVDELDRTIERLRELGLWVQVMPPFRSLGSAYGWVLPRSACGAWVGVIAPRDEATEPAPGAGHPTGIFTQVAHVGQLVDDLGAAAAFYGEGLELEIAAAEAWAGEGGSAVEARAPVGPAVVLVRADDPQGLLGRFRARHGEGLAYVALDLPDLDAAVAALGAAGFALQRRPADGVLPARAWVDPGFVGTYTAGSVGALLLLRQAAA